MSFHIAGEGDANLKCRTCGSEDFRMPKPYDGHFSPDTIGIVVRYYCAHCGCKGRRVSVADYLMLGYPIDGMSPFTPVTQSRVSDD